MNIASKSRSHIRVNPATDANAEFRLHHWLGLGLALLALFGVGFYSANSQAEPYLAVRNNQPCSACHVNPTGGGARNSYGSYYGSQILPAKAGDVSLFDGGALTETLRLGANLRTGFSNQNNDDAESSQGFETQSGQLYFHITPKGARFSLYIDEQVAPGAAINREAFVLMPLEGQHYLKTGRLFMPYGLRLEDDSAFVRQMTQFNFDNSDNGVELGLYFGSLAIHSVISNGASTTTNDDNQLHYLTRWEYLGGTWRLGANVSLNDAEAGQRLTTGVYAGLNLWNYVLLAEWDSVVDESIQTAQGHDQSQQAGLIELNRLLQPGLNLKLTAEYLDPDTRVKNNLRSRHSALLEYTPYANLQLRGGLRVSDDIPQRPEGNNDQVFMQLHVYY